MTIRSYTKDEFGKRLAAVVNAATPIRSIEHLKGRDQQLEEIERALYAQGRHIFIFGERGVGKSSLAATAAYQYQTADAEPIFVSGSLDETFQSIIVNIAVQALNRSKTDATKTLESTSFNFRGLNFGKGSEISAINLGEQIKSIGDAAELLKQVAPRHSKKPAVVLD